MKTCSICEQNKELKEFSRCKQGKGGISAECKSCHAKRGRKSYSANSEREKARSRLFKTTNPNKYKGYVLKSDYGITFEQYNKMLIKQNSVCAVCLQKETKVDYKYKKLKDLSVDHDHKTGKVRGLLCFNCNTAEGLLKGDLNIIRQLIAYLEAHLSLDKIHTPYISSSVQDQLDEAPLMIHDNYDK